MAKLSTKDESKIIAMVARGDAKTKIAKEMGIHRRTVELVVKRNEEAFEKTKAIILENQTERAQRIQDKSTRVLETKLDKAIAYEEAYPELKRQLLNGEIDSKAFEVELSKLEKMTTQEALSITKEMNEQLGGDDDNKPAQPRQLKDDLLKALKDGDEVALERIVLNPSDGLHNA